MLALEATAPPNPIWAGHGSCCSTPTASENVGVGEGGSHDWGPWSLLVATGIEESLEQRECGTCGRDQIEASDCLAAQPLRLAVTAPEFAAVSL